MSDEELGGGQRRGAPAVRGMRSEEDWQRLAVEFKATGLSARAFGQPRGVAPSTLLSRARRILRGQQLPGQPQGATKPFLAVPLKMEAWATPSATGRGGRARRPIPQAPPGQCTAG